MLYGIRLARCSIQQSDKMIKYIMSFKARNILPYFYLSLPFFGFSIVAAGQRGIRIDWTISFVFIYLMTIQIVWGKIRKVHIDYVLINCILLIIFVSFSIINPFLSEEPQNLENFLSTYLQFMLGLTLFIFSYCLRLNYRDLKLILRSIIIISAMISIFAIIQLMASYLGYEIRLPFNNPGRALQSSGYEEVTGPIRRSMGTFSEPRQLGAYLLTGLAISVVLWKEKIELFHRRFSQGILLWIIAFGIISSFSTSSIFNMIGFLFFFFFFELIFRKGLLRKSVLAKFSCVCLIFVLFGCAIYFSPMGKIIVGRIRLPNFGMLYSNFSEVKNTAFRWGAYMRGQRLAIEAFSDNIFFGVGLNNFQTYVMTHYPNLNGPRGCHGPLRFLAQAGIFGFAGFGMFIFSLSLRLKKKRKHAIFKEEMSMADLGLLLIIVSFIASFGSLFTLTSTFFWGNMTLIGLILRCKFESPDHMAT